MASFFSPLPGGAPLQQTPFAAAGGIPRTAVNADNPLAMGLPLGPSALTMPVTPIRAASARNLELMRSTVAPVTTIAEVDATNLKALHDAIKPHFEATTNIPLTYLPFFARATALALMAHPIMNSIMTPQGFIVPRTINLGFAVQTPSGVLLPVIRSAETKSIPELARDIYVLNLRAQSGQITGQEMDGQTFVITNPGRYGQTLVGTPTIAPPNVGTLSFEAITRRVVALDNDQAAIRPMMYIALTADHRAVDGADMVGFMGRVKQALETLAL